MTKTLFSAVGVVVLCVASCGGGGGSGGGDGDADGGAGVGGGGAGDGGVDAGGTGDPHFSCDNPNNGGRLCSDTVYPPALASFVDEELKTQCEPDGGTLGDTCDTTDAVGGCRREDAGLAGVTVTTWFYVSTAAEIMESCTTDGGTFVSP